MNNLYESVIVAENLVSHQYKGHWQISDDTSARWETRTSVIVAVWLYSDCTVKCDCHIKHEDYGRQFGLQGQGHTGDSMVC